MSITDADVAKIRKALKPDFDSIDKKIDQKVGQTEKNINKSTAEKIKESEERVKKEIKDYVHQGVNAVVAGVDNLFKEYQVDSRIKKLEKIHPKGKHIFEN